MIRICVMNVRILIIVFAVLSIPQCLFGKPLGGTTNEDLDSLLKWTEGTFSNSIQARVDSSYDNVTISSRRIWRSRTPGGWLIVSTIRHDSLSAKMVSKYVYHIRSVEEGMFEITIFSVSEAMAKADEMHEDIEHFSERDLTQRSGCELYLQAADRTFIGGTHGTACPGSIPEASYSTTELLISPRGLWWLELIYSPGGEAIGRAQKGAYALIRQ
ncbi:MAG: hypothetical protein HYX66_00985 [Ignavibacteria bacterium]|nr:hypothetical protein [Ignavibacteria bacterium]